MNGAFEYGHSHQMSSTHILLNFLVATKVSLVKASRSGMIITTITVTFGTTTIGLHLIWPAQELIVCLT